MREIHRRDEIGVARTELAAGQVPTWVFQGLDLRGLEDLLELDLSACVFLGCWVDEALRSAIDRQRALFFPRLEGLPYRPWRATLYRSAELMEGFDPAVEGSFAGSTDMAIYRHFQDHRHQEASILEALSQRLHDHAIDDALQDLLAAWPRVVAVMGGHGLARSTPVYSTVARIGQGLAREGFLVATGGGPGAMEAANLGAWMAERPEAELEQAIRSLAVESDWRRHGYLRAAVETRDRFSGGRPSLAIPTWFYGHEPTNLFATEIAKYFSNSLREDGLLAIATHGVVYAPGSAGTVQEIFMDAAQNHYGTFRLVSPMIFLDRGYWEERLPVRSLIERLAQGRQYRNLLAFEDDAEAVVARLLEHAPVVYEASPSS